MLKSEIRQRILAARDAIGARARADFSARITERLIALPAYEEARCVMAYMTLGPEFDTAAFIADVFRRGKALALPRVERAARALKLHLVRDPAADLAPGVWGIREPDAGRCPEIAPGEIDLVLVPGVAFTARCDRLGYGAGYYDRLIPRFGGRAALVAAAYSAQIVPEIPMNATDQPVNLVLTEDGEYRRRSKEESCRAQACCGF